MTGKNLTLADACTAIVDCEHKTAPIDPEGQYFAVGTPAMRGNRIDYGEARRISEETFQAWTRRLTPRAGDLLFAREAPVGPVVRIPGTRNVAPGQRTVLLRPDPFSVESDYLFYLLTSREQQVRLLQKAEGSTVPHLNVADVRAFELPLLPPLNTQKEIAATLRALDDKIESNRRAQRVGEGVLRAQVEALFEESDGDDLGVLADYCSLAKESVKVWELHSELNYIGLEHVPRGSIFLDSWTSAEGLASNKSRFQAGDILFGKLRPYFKKVGVAPVDGVCSTDILVLRPRTPAVRALVAIVASSDSLIDSLSASSTGTRMPRASWNDLARWPVPRLTAEQLSALESSTELLLERLARLTFESKRLEQLRDALLPELLSGRIRVPVEGVVA